MPPKWSPLQSPIKLDEDKGVYYRDRNAARYPDHPMEPTIEAIMTSTPVNKGFSKGLEEKQIDIVACNNTLGNLLRFVRGDDRPFRILVEVVNQTVHLIRREKSPTEIIPNVRGYGHAFPENYTVWNRSVKFSTSHQRILGYSFGGIKCVVRFEADGYLPNLVDGDKETRGGEKDRNLDDTKTIVSIDDFPFNLDFGNDESVREMRLISEPGTQPLRISSAGIKIPQCSIFDLKTRSVKRKVDEQETFDIELPRMWLAQIPNFVLAYHEHGTFQDINVQDVRQKLSQWETEMAASLQSFKKLLHKIIELARSNKDGRLEIVHGDGANHLEARAQCSETQGAFSAETRERWQQWLSGCPVALRCSGEVEEQEELQRLSFNHELEEESEDQSNWRDFVREMPEDVDEEPDWEDFVREMAEDSDEETRWNDFLNEIGEDPDEEWN